MKNFKGKTGLLLGLLCLFSASVLASGTWKRLKDDGIHDPSNPAIKVLQEPGEALSALPSDTAGNMVDWIKAFREGYIQPRVGLHRSEPPKLLDSDILFKDTADMPWVLFPHLAHTEWLDCKNCHSDLFEMEVGKTDVNMFHILSGNRCGVCHGAVSFPLTECKRCHSILPETGESVFQTVTPDTE